MDYESHIETFRKRYAEIEANLSDPAVFGDARKSQELTREFSRVKRLVEIGERYLTAKSELVDNQEMLELETEGSELADSNHRTGVARRVVAVRPDGFAQYDCGDPGRCGWR